MSKTGVFKLRGSKNVPEDVQLPKKKGLLSVKKKETVGTVRKALRGAVSSIRARSAVRRGECLEVSVGSEKKVSRSGNRYLHAVFFASFYKSPPSSALLSDTVLCLP